MKTVVQVIEAKPAIYLRDFTHKKEHLARFINNLINNYNRAYSTYDVVFDTLTCDPDKCRSFGDIYKICQHYYPEAKMEYVKKVLIGLRKRGKIRSLFCGRIMKRVYYPKEHHYRCNDISKLDEYGMKFYETDFNKEYNEA